MSNAASNQSTTEPGQHGAGLRGEDSAGGEAEGNSVMATGLVSAANCGAAAAGGRRGSEGGGRGLAGCGGVAAAVGGAEEPAEPSSRQPRAGGPLLFTPLRTPAARRRRDGSAAPG